MLLQDNYAYYRTISLLLESTFGIMIYIIRKLQVWQTAVVQLLSAEQAPYTDIIAAYIILKI